MANLKYGSTGSDVKKLQTALIDAGYDVGSTGADGVFGKNTQAAVQAYQKANGLAVDGIAGTNTLGSLYGTSAAPAAATTPTTTPKTTAAQETVTAQESNNGGTTYQYVPYQASDTVKQADAMLQQYLSQKPGEYQSQWQGMLDELLYNIQNREKFSYDMNSDALYQQYKDQYVVQGQKAMMDTMGQAQAMTGGYGNSWAQSVGQQAYQGELQQLNDVLPELYQMALSKYQMEGEDMANQYAMIGAREDQDYGRYQDKLSEYYTELARLQDDARYQSETDYAKYWQDLGFAYQQDRDKVADDQWQAEMDETVRQFDTKNGVSSGGSGSTGNTGGTGNTSGGGGGYDNQGIPEDQIKQIQNALGVAVDGKWGAKSTEAAGGMSAAQAYEAWLKGELGNSGGGGPEAETGFTGTTYSEAVAYMKSKGVVSSHAANILTESEWRRAKASNSPRDGANEFDSYKEYLEAAVGACIEAYGSK